MPLARKHDDRIIRLLRKEAKKFKATVKEINLEKQILDIECPEENKDECAVAIEKLLEELIAK
jgi:hypothetical protein